MKKLLLGALLVVGIAGVSYSSDYYASSFYDVEAAYNQLRAEEAILIEQKRMDATDAQRIIDEQQRVYAELKHREAKLADGRKYKFYKKEYRELGKQYATMRKELEAEISAQQEIVEDYRIISQ